MIVTGYQTLEDRDNIDEVEQWGPYSCDRSNAWLGHGFYFWDTNITWAHEWGKNAHVQKGYLIGRCKIDLKMCFDLCGSVEHKMEFMRIIEVIQQSGKLKSGDRLTVPNIIQYMVNMKIFNFNAVRANDYPDAQRLYFTPVGKEFTMLNQRVQICVKVKKDVILPPFSVIFPEN